MFKYSKDGVSVLTTQDSRRKKQSGLYPVKIQVVHNRIQRYYNTGKELSTEEWATLATSKSPKLMAIRSDVKNSFEKVENTVRSLLEEGNFSFDNLNIRLGKSAGDTLNMAYKNKINSLNESGAVGNAGVYSCSFRHLETYAGEKIAFDTITVDWLKRYEKAMLAEGKSYTTISMYLRSMRAIFNEVKSVGIIKETQYPFGKPKSVIRAFLFTISNDRH
jgi:hypothetical protein